MVPMFELICHRTYGGFGRRPVDLSDHDHLDNLREERFLEPAG